MKKIYTIGLVFLLLNLPVLAGAQEPIPPEKQVLNHLNQLTDILKKNKNKPDDLLQKFSEYIKTNKETMEQASKDLEEKLKAMTLEEREAFEKNLETEMTGALSSFLEAMMAFQEKFPEKSEELTKMMEEI